MSVSNEDIMQAIQGMASRIEGLESTAKAQGAQLGSFAEVLSTMQAGQASAAAWQAEVKERMEKADEIIAQLQGNLQKESPRKQARTTDQMDTDGYSTPVGDSSTGPPPVFAPAPPARQVSFSPFGTASAPSSA